VNVRPYIRNRVLGIVASEPLTTMGIKTKFRPKNRREAHHALHDLEYEGIIKWGWDHLYRMSEIQQSRV